VPPPRFDSEAEVWVAVCPWCAGEETHQVGTETESKVVVWCRTCSGSSWLLKGEPDLQARTPPKVLHDKRRENGKRLPKQNEPKIGSRIPHEYRKGMPGQG
jgi:hypothetical protein